jgi:hypothetical protein
MRWKLIQLKVRQFHDNPIEETTKLFVTRKSNYGSEQLSLLGRGL